MTVVVEGTEGSGSLITASFAQDLGRDVGAVPGQVDEPAGRRARTRCLPTARAVVRSAADVLDALYGPGKRTVHATGTGAAPHAALAARLEPRLRRLLEAVEGGIGSVEGLAGAGTSRTCLPASRSSSCSASSARAGRRLCPPRVIVRLQDGACVC